MKKMLNIFLSLTLVSVFMIPVAVGAVAEGESCTRSGGECDAGLSCNLNLVAGEDDGLCSALASPQGSQYGLTDFTDVGLNQNSDIKGSIAN
ncbi:MAG: hypothetical protein CO042_02115, partial [Parcubacteria group bacterium CG_4_9_14_0_2_um_filter_41_8]